MSVFYLLMTELDYFSSRIGLRKSMGTIDVKLIKRTRYCLSSDSHNKAKRKDLCVQCKMKKKERKKGRQTDRQSEETTGICERERERGRDESAKERRKIFLHHRRSDVASTNISGSEVIQQRTLSIEQKMISSHNSHRVLLVFFRTKTDNNKVLI